MQPAQQQQQQEQEQQAGAREQAQKRKQLLQTRLPFRTVDGNLPRSPIATRAAAASKSKTATGPLQPAWQQLGQENVVKPDAKAAGKAVVAAAATPKAPGSAIKSSLKSHRSSGDSSRARLQQQQQQVAWEQEPFQPGKPPKRVRFSGIACSQEEQMLRADSAVRGLQQPNELLQQQVMGLLQPQEDDVADPTAAAAANGQSRPASAAAVDVDAGAGRDADTAVLSKATATKSPASLLRTDGAAKVVGSAHDDGPAQRLQQATSGSKRGSSSSRFFNTSCPSRSTAAGSGVSSNSSSVRTAGGLLGAAARQSTCPAMGSALSFKLISGNSNSSNTSRHCPAVLTLEELCGAMPSQIVPTSVSREQLQNGGVIAQVRGWCVLTLGVRYKKLLPSLPACLSLTKLSH